MKQLDLKQIGALLAVAAVAVKVVWFCFGEVRGYLDLRDRVSWLYAQEAARGGLGPLPPAGGDR